MLVVNELQFNFSYVIHISKFMVFPFLYVLLCVYICMHTSKFIYVCGVSTFIFNTEVCFCIEQEAFSFNFLMRTH